MLRKLLLAGGVINALFFLFHIYLGVRIQQLPLEPGYLALMQALNAGGVLFIFLFAWSSLFQRDDLLTTRLGRTVLFFVALLYLSRAAEEFVLFPRVSMPIVVMCTAVGALYLWVFAGARRLPRAVTPRGETV